MGREVPLLCVKGMRVKEFASDSKRKNKTTKKASRNVQSLEISLPLKLQQPTSRQDSSCTRFTESFCG